MSAGTSKQHSDSRGIFLWNIKVENPQLFWCEHGCVQSWKNLPEAMNPKPCFHWSWGDIGMAHHSLGEGEDRLPPAESDLQH